MPGFSPLNVLEKVPIPEPSLVLELLTVGFCSVLQQTPRDVTEAPPSLVTLPPDVAPVEEMFVTDAVEIAASNKIIFLQLYTKATVAQIMSNNLIFRLFFIVYVLGFLFYNPFIIFQAHIKAIIIMRNMAIGLILKNFSKL